ncbi:hypothetical protein BC827DRAFT_1272118 [Russula dissimulans]|nr:hypothetical protein BC827DRAFT_1272118 [Russula dissimulans]
MGYYTEDSEQYASWKKLQDSREKDGFTTEALAFAAQYEALQVWEDYVKSKGNLKGKQARDLVYKWSPYALLITVFDDGYLSRTVAEGWVVLQTAQRYKLGVNVDYKTAQREGE